MNNKRSSRIGSEIKKVVSELLLTSIKDPRISSMTTISDVEVTRDLSYATIYVSVFGNDEQRKNTIEGLENSKGYIKREIGKAIDLRYTPDLIFKIDNSTENGIHIQELLNKVKNEDSNV